MAAFSGHAAVQFAAGFRRSRADRGRFRARRVIAPRSRGTPPGLPCLEEMKDEQRPSFLIFLPAIEKELRREALTWHGKGDIRCESVPDPKIGMTADAVIKVTACAICGSGRSYFSTASFHPWRLATSSP